MAEGFLKHYGSERFEVYSAGTKPSIVNPSAVQVMREAGIDISSHRSKHLDEFKNKKIDYVITVCDNAKEHCPFFPAAVKVLHWPFPDPPHNKEKSDSVINEFRHVRDLIQERFKHLGENGFPEQEK